MAISIGFQNARGDCHTSGAPRSGSQIKMIAGGNHTMILCALVRNDTILEEHILYQRCIVLAMNAFADFYLCNLWELPNNQPSTLKTKLVSL